MLVLTRREGESLKIGVENGTDNFSRKTASLLRLAYLKTIDNNDKSLILLSSFLNTIHISSVIRW